MVGYQLSMLFLELFFGFLGFFSFLFFEEVLGIWSFGDGYNVFVEGFEGEYVELLEVMLFVRGSLVDVEGFLGFFRVWIVFICKGVGGKGCYWRYWVWVYQKGLGFWDQDGVCLFGEGSSIGVFFEFFLGVEVVLEVVVLEVFEFLVEVVGEVFEFCFLRLGEFRGGGGGQGVEGLFGIFWRIGKGNRRKK